MVGPSGGDLAWLLIIPLGASFLLAIPMLFSWRTFRVLLHVAAFDAMYLVIGMATLENGLGILMLIFFPWVLCISLIVGWLRVSPDGESTQSGYTERNPPSWPDLEHEELSNLITTMRRDGFTIRRVGLEQWGVSEPNVQLVKYYYSNEEFLSFARRHYGKDQP